VREVKKALLTRQPLYILYCKELNLNSNVSNKLPSGVVATENHDGRRRSKKYRKNGEKKKIESPP